MRCFIFAAVLLGLSTFAGATSIAITNPSFESNSNGYPGYGPITGWTGGGGGTGTNDVTQPFDNGHTIPDGSQIAFAQGVADISQTLPGFVNGQKYELVYYEDSRGNTATAASIEVDLGGTAIVAAHDVSATQVYAKQVVDFTYTGPTGSALLDLKSLRPATNGTNDNTALFDDISIVTAPEPASLALLGFGSFGVLGLRRRGK